MRVDQIFQLKEIEIAFLDNISAHLIYVVIGGQKHTHEQICHWKGLDPHPPNI